MISEFVIGIIISVSMFAVSTGISLALAYLNKPKTKKSIFDSHTYHENGMINNIQPGTPKNIVYGEHRIAPAIINKYSFATTDEDGNDNHTKTEILCSLGEETTGVWGVRVNDQSIRSAYSDGKGYSMWWAPGGRTNQLIYESRSIKKGTLFNSITPGYNKTIDFDYDKGNNSNPFQGTSDSDSTFVSASLPGYVLIYEEGNKDSYEVVRYEGIAAYGATWRLTGCLVTKDHAYASIILQEWQLAFKRDGTTPLSIMPHFGKNVIEQQDLGGGDGLLIEHGSGAEGQWSSTITTNNKCRRFAITMGFEKGLYGLDKKDGYYAKACNYQIRWRKQGETSWNTYDEPIEKTLHDSADSTLKLKIDKKAKEAYVVNADGTDFLEFKGNFGTHGLDYKKVAKFKKTKDYTLEFTTNTSWDFPLLKDNGFVYDPDYTSTHWNSATNSDEYKYRCKIKLDTSKKKYTGPTRDSTNPVDFKITYKLRVRNNIIEVSASPGKAVLSAYRLTHLLPENELLDYAKYEMQVKKTYDDIDDAEKGQNELRWLNVQEMDTDAMEYPYESLLGFRLKMNEKINSTIENITCMAQGKGVIDVQNASNVWAVSTAYSSGDFVRPTVHNGLFYRCRTGGTSGGSEPSWPDIGTKTDGSVTPVTWEIANRTSSNPLDICADIIMSKRYGRGKYLELTNDRITAFYDKLKTEAAFANESITENSKARKRFSLNFNLDFRGPLIDLLQSLGNTFRGKFYFDGEIPLCFIDRKKTPTAMFCMGNIVEDSYKPEALNLSDNINRIQAQYLNRDKNYSQDTDEADIISVNNSWTVSRLQDKTIALYGLTKKWYVRKIVNYMLRFAWYTRNSTSFQTTLDGLSVDIGDTFYCHDDTMNLTAQSGRLIKVYANYIDLDKPFTFQPATTYKALLRKDNGQPHTELIVDLTTTGTGAKTRVYFTSGISSVSDNSIYILGTGTYYMMFRCVQKSFKINAIEIGALEYVEDIYKIYKNDTTDPAWTEDTDETVNEKETALPTNIVPPEIPQMVLIESRKNFGEVEVHIRPPAGSLEWQRADIYYQEENVPLWNYAGTSKGDILRVPSLRIGKEYDFKAVSISPSGIANNNETTATITLAGDSDMFKPDIPSGVRLIGKGSETNVYGSDFEFEWNRDSKLSGDDSTSNYIKHAGLSNIYENVRYRISVYFPDIPATVKHGGVSVKDKIAHEEVVTDKRYRFRFAQNIEATKSLWESYSTHASYGTYYGNPRRKCLFKIQTINGYGNVSNAAEITLTNPAPDMKDSSGNNTTPELKALKSAIRAKFKHPYQEYDISHFVIWYATDSGFTQNLKKVRVASVININSSDEDIDNTLYKTEIDGLDPKKTYYFKIKPFDVYGGGDFSEVASAQPGINDDEADEEITKPDIVQNLTFAIQTNGRLKGSWDLLSARDIDEYIYEWRGVKNTSATNPPDLDDVEAGTDGTYECEGEKKSVKVKDSDETATRNWFTLIPKTGFKYWFRARAKNTSRKYGNWASWVYHTGTVETITTDDMPVKWAMYKFLGTVTAVDKNHVSVGITGGSGLTGLKKKTNSGTTNIALNNLSSTLFSGTRFIAYDGTATLKIKTDTQMEADDTLVAIAKIIEAPSGKCNVLVMLSSTEWNISAYGGAFNQVETLVLTGTTIQTSASGQRVVMSDAGIKAYNSSGTQTAQILNDGSGWLGSSSAFSWNTSGTITATGIEAGSVAAENITGTTLTGKTIQTASTGKRFVVTASINEAEFYGDRGDTIIEKLATIGIQLKSGLDYIIGDFGNIGTNNTRIAIRARAYNKNAIESESYSANGITGVSASGTGVAGSSSSGAGVSAVSSSFNALMVIGNSTRASLLLYPTAQPSGHEAGGGDLYIDSTTGDITYWHPTLNKWRKITGHVDG